MTLISLDIVLQGITYKTADVPAIRGGNGINICDYASEYQHYFVM